MKRYGIKLSGVEKVDPDGFRRHPLNIIRQGVDPENDRILTADLKKEGQNEPIIATPDYKIVVGWRRYLRLKKQGAQIDVRWTEQNPPKEALLKLIYRDNTIREGYSQADYESIALAIYPPSVIYGTTERNLERKLEDLTGIKSSIWKQTLARMRQRNQNTGKIQFNLKEEEKKYARRLLGELDALISHEEVLKQDYEDTRQKRRNLESEITALLPRSSGIKGKEARIEAIRKKAQ